MKNFILWLLIAFTFIGSVVYFVFTSDNSFNITYIKFNINPEFIIGVNENDEVKIFNPLNDDAKVLNLGMFNGYSLDKSIDIILNKLDKSNYLDVSQIDITVITKSDSKINYYYDKINKVLNENYSNIVLVNNMASHEELLAYSNEVSYDIKSIFNEDIFKSISININDEITNYVNNLINELNIEELELIDKIDVLDQKILEGYFDNFELNKYQIKDYDLIIKDNSSYKVNFSYNEEGYDFNIELSLYLEYKGQLVKEDITYNTIEEYHFNFKNNEIYGIKNNFYKFK